MLYNKYMKRNVVGLVILSLLVFSPLISFAVDETILPAPGETILPGPPGVGKIINPLAGPGGTGGITTVQGFIQMLLTGVIRIGMPIIALAIIYCGFLFVFARGKPAAIEKARDALLYTLIGAALLLGSWALAILISETVQSLGS